MTPTIIKNSFIEIPYTETNYPENLWQNEEKFATLYLEIDDVRPTQEPQTILFSIDISGSMSDTCPDGRTKMQHIVHTTKNIIDVFSKETTNISVEIWGFDDKLEPIIQETKCTPETREEMHEKLTQSLNPRGTTNISIALKNANERLQNFSSTKRTHVFMTDGQVTSGPKKADQLTHHIDPSYPNIFVGFGSDHDAFLLQSLSNQSNYYYIDHIETAGLAYGEITHSILYQALKNVTITIQNGEIYDYMTNTWSNQLTIPSLVGEAKKTYHLRSTDPKHLKATIHSQEPNISEDVHVLPELKGAPPTDFTKYLYRQRTLELLYEAQQSIKSEQQKLLDNSYTYTPFVELIKKLKDFLMNIKDYIHQNNLQDESFMADLCDDIGITMTTLKRSNFNIAVAYSAGRARSNGTQGSFQPIFRRTREVTNFPRLFLDIPENN
ncbi:MAG: VWA domain-containing protein, partial [Crocinitomicaceae bacterium]|nr:VWA domain-containing protein [Crocinitomicaceae bacterium]